MRKFEYIGEDKKITLRKVTFKQGEAVEVKDALLADKIAVLPYFKEHVEDVTDA